MPEWRDIRPDPSEYGSYYATYVDAVPDGDILTTLKRQIDETRSLFDRFTEVRGDYRYEPGKWTVKEVIGHVNDCERVFAYRALRFARGDRTDLPGFDQDDYVAGGRFGGLPLRDLVDEFMTIRRGTLILFGGLDERAWGADGVANGMSATVRSLAWILAGHASHHWGVIERRYGGPR